MQAERCEFCQANFRPGVLVEGKCPPCTDKFPGAKSMKEWKLMQNKPTDDEVMLRDKIKAIIFDVLDEYGILAECACGNKFFRRSAAQKKCVDCKETD